RQGSLPSVPGPAAEIVSGFFLQSGASHFYGGSVIPQEKSAAVTRALHEAFGVTEFEDIRMLTKGQSGALVYRIIVGGSPYLLRIITRTQDPTLPDHFRCMKSAAEAGLAPHIRYTSIEDRISMTDFVEAVPFPMAEALV